MKKKLGIVLTLMLVMSMLVGCVVAGGPGTMGAYQLKDVSEYSLTSAPDPDGAQLVELSEEEYAAMDMYTYTYEELAKYFVVEKIDASRFMEYFTFKVRQEGSGMSSIFLSPQPGYYVAGTLQLSYQDCLGEGIYNYNPLQLEGHLAFVGNGEVEEWIAIKEASLQLTGEAYIYRWVPGDITWKIDEDKTVLYVSSKATDGDYTLIEEYEENELEISYMLNVIVENGLFDQEEESTQTPESGTTEEQPSPEPNWSQPFMGKYYVGGGFTTTIAGIYIDEEYVYYKLENGKVNKVPLSEYKLEDGSYSFYDDPNSEMPSGFLYGEISDCFYLINGGMDVGMLEKADKEAYDAIGVGSNDYDGME